MKKSYILTLMAMLMISVVHAQIVQVTDIKASGDAGITGPPTMYNGELFFEADDGVIGDELYKIAADGSVVLVKDINTDAADASPNGDPKNFIEYQGMLYFNGNDGDNGADKHDSELWKTDGTTEGTVLVEDIWVGGDGNASNPQQMFVFNDKLYFNAKVGTANQVFRYDGVNPVAQITKWRDDGLASPFFPVVDEANGKAYIKAIAANGKYNLGIINADESTLMIMVNATANIGFAGTEGGVIYKGKYYFDGDNGTNGDELFVSDGTAEGTKMVKDILVGDDKSDSDPEGFTIYKDELYFMAELGDGMELWKTDGTEGGTVMVADPNPGGGTDLDHLTLYNDMLYFAASDGVNGMEVWVSDGTAEGTKMLKNLDGGAGDSKPQGFKEVDGKLFFTATDDRGKILWVTDGNAGYTMAVADALNNQFQPVNVNYAEFVSVGSVLYYTADDENGHDDIYSVDASLLSYEDVIFTVTDANGVVEGATVEFDGSTATTDVNGQVTFNYVRMGVELEYTVTSMYHESGAGTVKVADAAVSENVLLVLLPTYDVTFTVTDGTAALAGAEIAFNGTTGTTDAAGVYVFTEVLAASDMAYTITLAGYTDVTGTTSVVDQNVSVDEAMSLITYTVTFTVTDGTNALAGAEVAFNSTTGTTDASGVLAFTDVAPAADMAYTITLATYDDVTGTTSVVDQDVNVNEAMTLTAYTVTFTVTDGTAALAGAEVAFNSTTGTTDASGVVVFTDVVPAADMAYTITLADYDDVSGTVSVVDQDVSVDETMTETVGIRNALNNKLSVYPNPTSGVIHIEGLFIDATYEIYNISQQMIAKGILERNQVRLDVDAGLYILKVDSQGKTFMNKIIVK